MNKKGVMLKFIVSILLAIFIVLIPACMIGSKFFRLSVQAQDNFVEFAKELKDLAERGKEGEQRNFMLIMDDKTVIIGFSEDKFKSCLSSRCEEFERPNTDDCERGSCVCLYEEIKEKEEGIDYEITKCKSMGDMKFEVPKVLKEERSVSGFGGRRELSNYEKAQAEHYNYSLEEESNYVDYYKEESGFFMGRNLYIPLNEGCGSLFCFSEGNAPGMFAFEQRRNLIHFIKEPGKIKICLDVGCEDIKIPLSSPEEVQSGWGWSNP